MAACTYAYQQQMLQMARENSLALHNMYAWHAAQGHFSSGTIHPAYYVPLKPVQEPVGSNENANEVVNVSDDENGDEVEENDESESEEDGDDSDDGSEGSGDDDDEGNDDDESEPSGSECS